MRKVTYGAACSLDGFIAAADGGIDWLHFSRDVHQATSTYWKTVDTVLMGRKTYRVGQEMGGGGSADEPERGDPYPGVTTYVFSRTLESVRGRDVHLVRDDAGAFVRALKERPGRDICVMGGGELAASLLDAGVVDEIGLNIHPVLLGGGIPMFAAIAGRVPLELADCRTIDGGCLLTTYRVLPRS